MFSFAVAIIVLGISAVAIAFFMTNNKVEKKSTSGKIAGSVYGKHSEKPVKDAVVRLGSVESDNSNNKFIVKEGFTIKTDETGKFYFENVPTGSYWVMAEGNGKKVMKLVKVTVSDKNIDDVLLII